MIKKIKVKRLIKKLNTQHISTPVRIHAKNVQKNTITHNDSLKSSIHSISHVIADTTFHSNEMAPHHFTIILLTCDP